METLSKGGNTVSKSWYCQKYFVVNIIQIVFLTSTKII